MASKSEVSGPIFSLDEILKHHAFLRNEVFPVFSSSFREINTSPQSDGWKRDQYVGTVELYAWSKDASVKMATKGGNSFPAIEITALEEIKKNENLYVSWNESWRKQKIHTKNYELIAIGITFYSGLKDSHANTSERIFRAEWVERRKSQEVEAANPHWHIDWALGPDLTKQIDGIHLGMGGWDHATDGEPHEPWRRYIDNLTDARVWVKRVLEYGSKQYDLYYW